MIKFLNSLDVKGDFTQSFAKNGILRANGDGKLEIAQENDFPVLYILDDASFQQIGTDVNGKPIIAVKIIDLLQSIPGYGPSKVLSTDTNGDIIWT